MWITQLNIGIKRTFFLLMLLSLGVIGMYRINPLISYLLVGMLFVLTILLAMGVYYFGLCIRRKKYKIHEEAYEVRDYYFPKTPKENRRSIRHLSTGILHARLYHRTREEWAYFDIIRELLIKLGRKPKRVLILGGGGGSVAYTLLRDGLADFVDAVEKHAQVIDIAKQYFLPKPIPSSLRFIEKDAYAYVQQVQKPYDFIFVDVFSGITIPSQFMDAPFASYLKRALHTKGLLVINFGTSPGDIRIFLNNLRKHFNPMSLYYWHGILICVSPAIGKKLKNTTRIL